MKLTRANIPVVVLGFGLLILWSCEEPKNTTPNPIDEIELCTDNDSLINVFSKSAAVLAVRQMNADSGYHDSIEISASLYTKALKALLSVYLADSLNAWDTIFNYYRIVVSPDPSVNMLYLELDTTFAWVRSLVAGKDSTGQTQADSLLRLYRLNYQTRYYWGHGPFVNVWLYTPVNLHMFALARAFLRIEGVKSSDNIYLFEYPLILRHRDILFEDNHSQMKLTYYIGWGDCEAGCIGHHRWNFSISDSCEAWLISEEGDTPPDSIYLYGY